MHVCTFYHRYTLLCIVFSVFMFKLPFDNLLIRENNNGDDSSSVTISQRVVDSEFLRWIKFHTCRLETFWTQKTFAAAELSTSMIWYSVSVSEFRFQAEIRLQYDHSLQQWTGLSNSLCSSVSSLRVRIASIVDLDSLKPDWCGRRDLRNSGF